MKLKDYQLISPVSNKAVSLEQFNNDTLWRETVAGGVNHRNKYEDINSSSKYREAIGVLYRCIDVRSSILSSLPFVILKNDEVLLDSSNAWEEPGYEWLDGLPQLLYLTESSLLLSSEAFWFKDRNKIGSKMLNLQWLASPFVEVLYSEDSGIVGFKRALGNSEINFTPEQIAYFWIQNPLSELTPDIPQVLAAANSANVIINYEDFVSKFYERGAVKATILKVDRSTPPKERSRLREFWQNFMQGKGNAYATEVVSGDVEAEVIGEGAGDSEKTEVLVSRRKDIATAMGVPYSLLFGDTSSSYTAGPTEEKNFLKYTVIPRAKLIQDFLNKQLFKEQGLYFKFSIDTLPAFKDSGEIEAKIFTTYTSAQLPHSIAAQLAGISLPEGVTYADLDEMVAKERERQFKEKERIVTLNSKLTPEGQPQPQDAPKGKQPTKPKGEDNNSKSEELKTYRKWLKNRKNEDVDFLEFESDVLTEDDKLEAYKAFVQERGSDDTRPFGSSDLPFSTKAMVTYGNTEGEEPDGLSALEKKNAGKISQAFEEQLQKSFEKADSMTDEEFFRNFDILFRDFSRDLQNYILESLLSYADFGVMQATKKVHQFYPGFDSEESSYQAREWATRRASEVFIMVQEASLRRAHSIFDQYRAGNGLTIAWVLSQLKNFINLERAEVIAQNESIVVIRQSEYITYANTKLVQYVRWVTMRDERVCPKCGPLHGRIFPLGGAPRVPIHVKCRCDILPMVDSRLLRLFGEIV